MNPIASLLGAQNVKKLITHPYVSPLFGDFTGFPPLLIQCGDAECLRDEGTLLAHKASMAGVQVYHEVYEDCPHGKGKLLVTVRMRLTFLQYSKRFSSSKQPRKLSGHTGTSSNGSCPLASVRAASTLARWTRKLCRMRTP